MSEYVIFFRKGNVIIKLPINPEELEVSTSQAIEKYEILKLGQIAMPTHMELKEYRFEAELPHETLHYVETVNDFQNPEFYLDKFKTWREKLEPVWFMAGKTISGNSVVKDAINTPVLIESLTITEKAGEEHDKYVSFKLLEYREHKADEIVKKSNPKSTGYYVVKSGDTLWAIAKKYYGDGSKYAKIYNVNKGKIKNPSLIYPGQKLVIPS